MKKENNKKFKVGEQLSSNTSSLIIIVSCISVLMLIAYFGVSLTSKGTFSAGTITNGNYVYSCPSGVIQNIGSYYKCCPSDYPTLGAVSDGNSLYALNSDGYLCKNNNYVANASNFISDGGSLGYCLASGDYSNPVSGPVSCTSNGGIMVGTNCFFSCAVSPLGNAEYTINETTCESSQYGITIDTINNRVNLTRTTGCACPAGWTRDDSTKCHTSLNHSDNTHAAGYSAGGMSFLCKNGYSYSAPDSYCRKCDNGYTENVTSNGQIYCVDTITGESDLCAWGDYLDGVCKVTCNTSVVSSPSKENCEKKFTGYDCSTEQIPNSVYLCVGAKPSCTVKINDCILQGNINDGRVDADITLSSPVSYTYQWEFSGSGYKGGANTNESLLQSGTITRQSLFNIRTNESGNISAKITIRLSTGASCTTTRSLNVTPCTNCGGETLTTKPTTTTVQADRQCWYCSASRRKTSVMVDARYTCSSMGYVDDPDDLDDCDSATTTKSTTTTKKSTTTTTTKKSTTTTTTNKSTTTTTAKKSTTTTTTKSNVVDNPQTGSTAIIIAWVVGIVAIGYSFYYFTQTNKQ